MAKIAAPPAQKGKNTKRRAATDAHGLGTTGEAKEGTTLWEVITEDTVIFPEGGSVLTRLAFDCQTPNLVVYNEADQVQAVDSRQIRDL